MMNPEQVKQYLKELGLDVEPDLKPLTPMTEEERARFYATKKQAFCQHQYLFSDDKIICINCGHVKGS